MGQRNTIQVGWKDLFGEIGPIKTGQPATVQVEREVIPIIFVPGIMGSRLKRTRVAGMGGTTSEKLGKAWDPDSKLWLLYNFSGEGAEERRSQLVGLQFDPTYLEVIGRTPGGDVDPDDVDLAKSQVKGVPGAFERGWGGVSSNSYGSVLRALTNWSWTEPVRHCFDLPVHAYGYNWSDSNTASGAKLAQHAARVVAEYEAQGRVCSRVILVTHSMGGLVARAACRALEASNPDLVLGVVHGVQPASGAPSAYWRMKGGFPNAGGFGGFMTARVLGNNAAEVTVVLGNMPGALQLLPNKRYKAVWDDGSESPLWLRYRLPVTDAVVSHPQTGNPYQEIYLEVHKFYRLCDDRLLDPGDFLERDPDLLHPWNYYTYYIEEAELYHDLHQDYAHPDTVQLYGDEVTTVTRIMWDRTPDVDWGKDPPSRAERRRRRRGESEGPTESDEDANNNGARIRITSNLLPTDDAFVSDPGTPFAQPGDPPVSPLTSPGPKYLMTMRDADGEGDGTVPQTSGRVLDVGPGRTVRIGPEQEADEASREHEPIYKSGTAQYIAAAAIENLCLGLIEQETQK